ncbi:amidohydrolase family protein [Halobellus rubicundus]|uniref:Amidohydrolase family protein n=1 Tax=Halobellus rubicundus TaxID=2996466 RepID=A0ABD5MBA6_9EURY
MPEIIDATSHIMSHEALDELESVHPSSEIESLRNAPRMFDIEGRVDYLDANGIDRQVINLAAPMIWQGVDPDDGIEATRVANDEIARIGEEHDRFIPTGTVPFLTDEYVDEARRCVEELGMNGIQIFSNINGRMLDDDEFEEFYATIDDLDVPLWIHPQLAEWHDYDNSHTWIYKMLAWPFDTNIALARLIFSGVLDRYENIEIISHHLGGSFPYQIGRIRSWYQTRKEEPELYQNPAMADLSEPLDAYFDRIYGDTAVSSQGESYPLECGLEFFGTDNVVYSADYPFGPDKGQYWATEIIPLIEDLDIPEADKEKILSGNIKRLLDLE